MNSFNIYPNANNNMNQIQYMKRPSYNIKGNSAKFPLGNQIGCKHFKITYKTTTYYCGLLNFYGFDCFGTLKRTRIFLYL